MDSRFILGSPTIRHRDGPPPGEGVEALRRPWFLPRPRILAISRNLGLCAAACWGVQGAAGAARARESVLLPEVGAGGAPRDLRRGQRVLEQDVRPRGRLHPNAPRPDPRRGGRGRRGPHRHGDEPRKPRSQTQGQGWVCEGLGSGKSAVRSPHPRPCFPHCMPPLIVSLAHVTEHSA